MLTANELDKIYNKEMEIEGTSVKDGLLAIQEAVRKDAFQEFDHRKEFDSLADRFQLRDKICTVLNLGDYNKELEAMESLFFDFDYWSSKQ